MKNMATKAVRISGEFTIPIWIFVKAHAGVVECIKVHCDFGRAISHYDRQAEKMSDEYDSIELFNRRVTVPKIIHGK